MKFKIKSKKNQKIHNLTFNLIYLYLQKLIFFIVYIFSSHWPPISIPRLLFKSARSKFLTCKPFFKNIFNLWIYLSLQNKIKTASLIYKFQSHILLQWMINKDLHFSLVTYILQLLKTFY